MKKLIIALIALAGVTFGETFIDVTLTPAGTNTAVATYTAMNNRATYPYGLYQTVGGTTQTNTVTVKVTPYGQTDSYTVETLAAVISDASTLETFGIGDVTADVDPIIILPGDVLTLSGAGTAASNVKYVLRLKLVDQ